MVGVEDGLRLDQTSAVGQFDRIADQLGAHVLGDFIRRNAMSATPCCTIRQIHSESMTSVRNPSVTLLALANRPEAPDRAKNLTHVLEATLREPVTRAPSVMLLVGNKGTPMGRRRRAPPTPLHCGS